jgi:hypothetical protein
MFELFKQPYPSDDNLSWHLRKAVFIGLFVGLFLMVFQPFGLNEWQTPNKALKLLGFGVVTFLITGFNLTVWARIFPQLFDEQKWTVGREIIFTTANILLIAIANRFYLSWILDHIEYSGLGWAGMILVTFLIGLFPVTGLVLYRYITRLRKYSRQAAELPIPTPPVFNQSTNDELIVQPDSLRNSVVKLIADNEKDTLALPADELLFIESSDNYCTVVYLKNNQPVKPLLRSSLGRLEGQIAEQQGLRAHIVRCHRSYVVNLNRVERVTGNAQGYKLHLLDSQFVIPVARKYNDTLVAELKAL